MLELLHVTKRYQYQKVLDDVSLKLPERGMVALVGASGCGKSTLLHIIGGIDHDFQGEMKWYDKSVKRHLNRYRKQHVSFIFQQFHLIMWLSVSQNIELSHFFQKNENTKYSLDIHDFEELKMTSLSLGQRQRIAYLRAYYQQSDILLCDEPTGSLDPIHAKEVMELLKEEAKYRLVIIVSHDLKLVKKYSDEIYEMRDGQLIGYTGKQHHITNHKEKKRHHRKFFPFFRISWMSFLSHKSRSFQLIFGLTLSFLCIVLTLTMSRGLENQIQDYIYSLVPASSISFQSQNHQSLSLDLLKKFRSLPTISRAELYLDEYECLGVGFVATRYQESETLFIGDDTSPYHDIPLTMGEYPKTDHEIIVSLSTAQHLCQEKDISSLLNKQLYAWYKHKNQVKAVTYYVVGITSQTTALDTLYQRDNAYVHLLKDVYGFNEKKVKSQLGLLYVDKQYQRSDVIKQLQKDYPDYRFLEVGATTSKNINETMKQVQMVLILFSGLAILSSLFLIGEVMFLNVVQKKKDLAIMKCFGASTLDLLKIVLYESLEIVICAQLICTFLYYQLLKMVNMLAKEILLNDRMLFSFDYVLLLSVFGISFLFVLLSQLPPLFYVFKLNTIEALKE